MTSRSRITIVPSKFVPSTHLFFGGEPGFVLIVAGIHESEQSGIEIAHWIRVKLTKRPNPTRLGAIIIPDLFRERGGEEARTAEWKTDYGDWNKKGEDYREISDAIRPARHFPPPGKPLSLLGKGKDKFLMDENGKLVNYNGQRIRLLPEIEYLIHCIETFKPVRIVTCHGKKPRTPKQVQKAQKAGIIDMTDADAKKWNGVDAIKGLNFPGIFVDPRYQPASNCQDKKLHHFENCKFDSKLDPAYPKEPVSPFPTKRFDSAKSPEGPKDDALALEAAKAVFKKDPTLVPGNHVSAQIPVVHYHREPPLGPPGFSLGDWGPAAVNPKGGDGSRPGAPVFTIETKDNYESWAFFDGVQILDEEGQPLTPEETPEQRANNRKNKPYIVPEKFKKNPKRSKELQAYAEAIIDTILELQ